MALSYNKLWKLLIDKKLKKQDLINMAGLSKSTIAKLTKGENINTDIISRICVVLNCDISDIVEVKKENI